MRFVTLKDSTFIISMLVWHCFKAQTYIKIPTDTNYFWKQLSTCGNYQYQIRYSNDTLINSSICHKFSEFAHYGSNPCLQSYIRHGYLKQDTLLKKVSILDANFIERPLYDFSKMTGDTFLLYNRVLNVNVTHTVMQIQGTTQITHNSLDPGDNFISQGVGSLMGGLYGHGQFSGTNLYTEKLICFGKIYPFSIIVPPDVPMESQCFLITNLTNSMPVKNKRMSLFPNPANDLLNFKFENTNEIGNTLIRIETATGQIIQEENLFFYHGEAKINISQLPSGLYIVKMFTDEATGNIYLANYKLIINR